MTECVEAHLISDLLSRPLQRLESLCPSEGDVVDAVSTALARQSPASTPPETNVYVGKVGTIDGHIVRRLGHLVVNPNDPHRSRALNDSYVYHDSGGFLDAYANYSPESAQAFLEALISSAKREREQTLVRAGHITKSVANAEDPFGDDFDRGRDQSRLFVLHGPRGAGKTIFVNHLLSRYSGLLDCKKVIWVRLNLVEDFGSDDDLMHRIGLQACKILLRYYDSDSKEWNKPSYLDVQCAGYLAEFIRGNSHEATRILTLQEKESDIRLLTHAINVFQDKERDEPVRQDLLPKYVAVEAIHYAIRNGYSFIVVLDGLDRLDITSEAKSKHGRLLRSAIALGNKSDSISFSILIVTRNYHSEFEQIQSLFRMVQVPEYKLLPADVGAVIAKRIAMIRQEVATHPGLTDDQRVLGRDRLFRFERFLAQSEGDTPYLTKIRHLFQSNMRAKMQALQMSYFEFLEDLGEKRYQLVEMLMRSGKSYPPMYYRFRLEKRHSSSGSLENPRNRRIIAMVNERIPFDSRFFPSIFVPPLFINPATKDLRGRRQNILPGLRILQFLYADLALRQEKRLMQPMEVGDLARLCVNLFGYMRDEVVALVEVFVEFDLVRLTGGAVFDRPSSLERNHIEILPKGDALLNTFLYDIAYLNLAAMRLPLALEAFDEERVPFVAAAPFNRLNLRSWVLAKFRNSISLVRLVAAISTEQEVGFEVQLSKLRDDTSQSIGRAARSRSDGRGLFTFISGLKSEIAKQLSTVYYSLKADDHAVASPKEVIEMLELYEIAWGPQT